MSRAFSPDEFKQTRRADREESSAGTSHGPGGELGWGQEAARADLNAGPVTAHSRTMLDSFLQHGVLNERDRRARGISSAVSADDKRPPETEVRVNQVQVPEEASDEEIARLAEYLVLNPANGALPVALEQRNDGIGAPTSMTPDEVLATGVDPRVLDEMGICPKTYTPEQGRTLGHRAHDSALAVMDAKRAGVDVTGLDKASEMRIEHSIGADAFEALLVPSKFRPTHPRMQSVDSKKQQVHFNQSGHGSNAVDIDAPDYRTALESVLRERRGRALLTHVARLSAPQQAPRVGASAPVAKAVPERSPPEHSSWLADLQRGDDSSGGGPSGGWGMQDSGLGWGSMLMERPAETSEAPAPAPAPAHRWTEDQVTAAIAAVRERGNTDPYFDLLNDPNVQLPPDVAEWWEENSLL